MKQADVLPEREKQYHPVRFALRVEQTHPENRQGLVVPQHFWTPFEFFSMPETAPVFGN